jgi:hypothetical protein
MIALFHVLAHLIPAEEHGTHWMGGGDELVVVPKGKFWSLSENMARAYNSTESTYFFRFLQEHKTTVFLIVIRRDHLVN